MLFKRQCSAGACSLLDDTEESTVADHSSGKLSTLNSDKCSDGYRITTFGISRTNEWHALSIRPNSQGGSDFVLVSVLLFVLPFFFLVDQSNYWRLEEYQMILCPILEIELEGCKLILKSISNIFIHKKLIEILKRLTWLSLAWKGIWFYTILFIYLFIFLFCQSKHYRDWKKIA